MHTEPPNTPSRLFKPLGRKAEVQLLLNDDEHFSKTQVYIKPLIAAAIQRANLQPHEQDGIVNALITIVPLAAERFLAAHRDREATYKFSTYFTWYINQALDQGLE